MAGGLQNTPQGYNTAEDYSSALREIDPKCITFPTAWLVNKRVHIISRFSDQQVCEYHSVVDNLQGCDNSTDASITAYDVNCGGRPFIYINCVGLNSPPTGLSSVTHCDTPSVFLTKVGRSWVDIRKLWKLTGQVFDNSISKDKLYELLAQKGYDLDLFDDSAKLFKDTHGMPGHRFKDLQKDSINGEVVIDKTAFKLNADDSAMTQGVVRFSVTAIYEVLPDGVLNAGNSLVYPTAVKASYDSIREGLDNAWIWYDDNPGQL